MPRNCTVRRLSFSGPPAASVCARDLGHRPQPVQDPSGQADLLGERLVDVDRAEVAGGAGVPDSDVRVRRDLQFNRVPDDVPPLRGADRLAALVLGHGLEHGEPHPAARDPVVIRTSASGGLNEHRFGIRRERGKPLRDTPVEGSWAVGPVGCYETCSALSRCFAGRPRMLDPGQSAPSAEPRCLPGAFVPVRSPIAMQGPTPERQQSSGRLYPCDPLPGVYRHGSGVGAAVGPLATYRAARTTSYL